MPNVLSPRDLVSRPDNMDETVSHTLFAYAKTKMQMRSNCAADQRLCFRYIDSTIILQSKSEISSL